MRKSLLILIAISWTITALPQSNPTRIYKTVQVDKSTSMSATEVTVEEWICFIISNNFDTSLFPNENSISASLKVVFNDLKQKNKFKFLRIITNTGLQKKYFGDKGIIPTEEFKNLQSSDRNYLGLRVPITGITFNQVLTFCKWKQALVNKQVDKNLELTISLPTIEMYNRVITNIDSFCVGKCDSCNKYRLNYNVPKCGLEKQDKATLTQGHGLLRVDSYWSTELGLYCLQGNAAEMTSTEGVAIGGSFRHSARQSFRDHTQEYKKAEDWLGFRYVVTR